MEKFTDPEALTRYITDEIFKFFKQSPESWTRRIFGGLFRLPTHRFASLAYTFDRLVEKYGFAEAALRVLPVFTQGFEANNTDNIPREGPLLITSNHPGTCDSLVIAANVPRTDLKIVATGIPFIQGLKNAADHLIYTTLDIHERMTVVRAVIRHLKQGGAVLIFPTGRIDPDPALNTEASEDISKWSPSIEIMLRTVPQTRVMLSVVSGVLSARWRWNPIVRLFGDDHSQRSLAEGLQVIQQLLYPNTLFVTPRVTFSNPFTTEALAQMGDRMLDGMIVQARSLLECHMAQEKLLPASTS